VTLEKELLIELFDALEKARIVLRLHNR
jgi:hypothetical protein